MDGDIRRGERPQAPQKGRGKPKNSCSYRNAWFKKPSARPGSDPQGSIESPLERETRSMGLRMSRLLRETRSSVNSWEFITRTVPKGARRAVNRWKGPKPKFLLGEIEDASPRRKSFHPATREVGTWLRHSGE